MKIILIGYRCTGKTSVGKRMAERLGIPFCDTDELIQAEAGITIAEIVAAGGWDAFRQWERAIINTLPSSSAGIIAVGGGAVMGSENRRVLKQLGSCVWLTADVKTIVERMGADQESRAQRPPLTRDGLEEETLVILRERTPLYEALADFVVVTTGKQIDAIADEVWGALASQGHIS
jgi:shikimate kinase